MRITQAHKEEIRMALVRSGLRLFTERGFHGTTVEQIAAAAGVAKGTFYNYFATKEDLALAGLADILVQVRAELERLLETPAPTRSRLAAFFGRFGEWSSTEPQLVWLWCVEQVRRGPSEGSAVAFRDMLTRLFAAGQEAGEIRTDRSPEEMAVDLGGITLAHIADWYDGGTNGDLVARLSRAADAYLCGALLPGRGRDTQGGARTAAVGRGSVGDGRDEIGDGRGGVGGGRAGQ